MSKVTVSLYGGLGNQLFQFATALSLAQRQKTKVFLDLSWFNKDHIKAGETPRAYALNVYDLESYVSYQSGFNFWERKYSSRWINFLIRKYIKFGATYIREESTNFNPELLKSLPPIWLDGYWQSYKYFEDIQDLLRKIIGTPREMSPQTSAMLSRIKASESICIHVRRGDYVTNQSAAEFHGLCGLNYYYAGLDLIVKNLNQPHAYIFSDDPLWVKYNFNLDIPSTVVDINGSENAHQDLWLMAACRHFLIANSSLSWWGAWLSGNSNKIVVAPKQWFLNNQYSTEDLIPLNWIRI
jgi:Glycosyl transferase family 11